MTADRPSECAVLPCPFCGGAPKQSTRQSSIENHERIAFIVCYCGGYSARAHQTGKGESDEAALADAAAAWNRRTYPPVESVQVHEWQATGWVRGYEFSPGSPGVSAERMIEFGWEPVQHVPPSTPYAPPIPKPLAAAPAESGRSNND